MLESYEHYLIIYRPGVFRKDLAVLISDASVSPCRELFPRYSRPMEEFSLYRRRINSFCLTF
jgi:hypothetical protein